VSLFLRVFAATLPWIGMLAGAPAGSIRGLVRDSSGGTVIRAEVTAVSSSSGERFSVRSQADGVFEFVRLAPGAWMLTAEAPGFRRVEIADVMVFQECRIF